MSTPAALFASGPPDPRQDTPTAEFRCFIASTVTGRVVTDVPFLGAPRWQAQLNETGHVEADIALGDAGMAKSDVDTFCDSWRWSLGFAWGNTILQAGPILSEKYDDPNPHTTVQATGLGGLFTAKRVLIRPTWSAGQNWAAAGADVVHKNLSLHTIAKRLVQGDLSRPGHSLPVVLPADIAGNAERTYPGYDLAKVGERLTELTQVDGGPEIEFRPEWTDEKHSAIQWRMRIGNPRLGQRGFPHAWDYGAGLVAVGVDIDGSQQGFGWWVKGDGMERETRGAYHADRALVDAGGPYPWPMLEEVDSEHTSATEQATLQAWARADVATHRRAVRLTSAVVRLDGGDATGAVSGSPSLDLVAPGDSASFGIRGHRRLPDGQYRERILGFTAEGDDLGRVRLALQGTAEPV